MKNFILNSRLFEASNNTNGLSYFIMALQEAYPGNDDMFQELSDYIVASGCPAIKFDTIYGAMGISKTDECIINKSILSGDLGKTLYTILHEIVHQYQYSKYGKDVVWDAYNSNIDIDEAVNLLMNIELVADRLAVLKANNLLKSHDIKNKTEILPFYSKFDKSYFKSHLEGLREEVKKKGMTSVKEVNEYMYNKLKIKPKPITYRQYNTPTARGTTTINKAPTFNNQSIIDKILDKLSAGSWSDLTEKEKNILRAASKK